MKNHGDAHGGNCLGSHGEAKDNHKYKLTHSKRHTDLGPVDNGLHAAVLAGVFAADERKEDGGQHSDHAQDGGKTHVADQDTVDQGRDDGLGHGDLSHLVGGLGGNVALQGLVALQNGNHILNLQRLLLADAPVILGLIESGDADADHDHAEGAHCQADFHSHGQENLVELTASHGENDHRQCDRQNDGDQIVERSNDDTHHGTLLGIIGHDGGQSLGRHVGDGVADDVQDIQSNEHHAVKALGGHPIEHQPQGNGLNGKASGNQNPQLAELRIHLVIQQGQQRVGDAVQDTGACQYDADDGSGHAEADHTGVVGVADQGINAHSHKRVAGIQDDLPELRSAVLYAVDLTLGGFSGSCHEISSFNFALGLLMVSS